MGVIPWVAKIDLSINVCIIKVQIIVYGYSVESRMWLVTFNFTPVDNKIKKYFTIFLFLYIFALIN